MRRRGNNGGQEGAAAVEFALVVPFLLMIVFAIITFGFLFAQDLALGNSSRQTARYGAVQGHSCAAIIAEAKDSAKPLVDADDPSAFQVEVKRGPTSAGATSTCSGDQAAEPCEGSGVDDNLYVRVDYEADVLIPMIPGMGPTMGLRGEGVFRCEFS